MLLKKKKKTQTQTLLCRHNLNAYLDKTLAVRGRTQSLFMNSWNHFQTLVSSNIGL